MENAQKSNAILKWLNSLPEVQALLQAEFEARPIDKRNLSEYRTHGAFHQWQLQRAALAFSAQFNQASPSPLPPAPTLDNFIQWISLRLAAAAESSPHRGDPRAQLEDIRAFLADIVILRRGELISRRIGLEEQRLAAAKAKNHQHLEQLFWEWTKRADIQAKLYPHRDPDKLRRNVVRMLDRELLGSTKPPPDEPDPEPACFI
jgi:hypothetical protein